MAKNEIDDIINATPTSNPSRAPSGSGAPVPSGPGLPANGAAPAVPPPGSRPGGKADGEVHFHPDTLKRLGDALEKNVGAILKNARYKLNVKPRDAQPDAFTTFGFLCAMAYTEVIEFADQDIIDKEKLLMDFNDRLHKAAKNQDEAERKSTLSGGN